MEIRHLWQRTVEIMRWAVGSMHMRYRRIQPVRALGKGRGGRLSTSFEAPSSGENRYPAGGQEL